MKAFLTLFFAITCISSFPEKMLDTASSAVDHLEGLTFAESLTKWEALKKENGNSYTYQTTFQSWAGFGSKTEITVLNGKVVARMYQEFTTDEETAKRTITEIYTETNKDLGTHQQGAAPWTIDELYSSCAKDYLVADTKKNTIYFQTKTDGLMTICGFVPHGCADDCFEGISIDSFEWLD